MYGFNMTSIRSLALKEPLVDVVERNQICTDTCLLKVLSSVLFVWYNDRICS